MALKGFRRNKPNVVETFQVHQPSLIEIGVTGNVMSAGQLLQQDYNTDLRTPQAYDVYDRMRKSDGQVRAALNVIKLPLLSANWFIEPASKDPLDVEIAQFVENTLIEGLSSSWQTNLRQILLHLDYGSMPFELVWQLTGDDKVGLRKLAPRLPKTITEWRVDDKGGPSGITQSTSSAQGYVSVTIPIDKLVIYVNEQEGSDFKGVSVLRAAYKHWFFKDKMYIIDAIAKERRAIGVDVGRLGPDASKDDQRALEIALMGLHAHEKQYLVEQADHVEYRIEGLQGRPLSTLDSIEHHDLRILRSVLAEFLAMGAGSTGSLAMHQDKSAFFLMALRGVAQNIVDTTNTHLIPKMVDFNWSVEKYPKLRHSQLETRPVQDIAEGVSTLMQAGALTPTRDIEDAMRSLFELPEIPDEEESSDELVESLMKLQLKQADKMFEVMETGRSKFEDITVPFKSEFVEEFSERLNPANARMVANMVGDKLKARMLSTSSKVTLTRAEIRRILSVAV